MQNGSKDFLPGKMCIRDRVHIEHAEGLADCKKILTLAKAGKIKGCLIAVSYTHLDVYKRQEF